MTKKNNRNALNPMRLNTTYSLKLCEDDIDLLKEKAKEEGWTVGKLIRYSLFTEGYIYSCK